MQKQDATVFDTEWEIYYNNLIALESCFAGKSIFISEPNLYQALAISNPTAAASVYWFEVLGRAYLASAAGLMRSLRWLNGVRLSIAEGNFLSFAANLRGLLESAADQCHSLKNVPLFLAENYDLVMEQLYCKSPLGTIALCEELEDLLIHFYHARKISRRDSVDVRHPALTSARYLACLQGEQTGSVFDLYAQLCDLTHPAMGSLSPFVGEETGGGYMIKDPNERQAIYDLCDNSVEAIRRITVGINCCLLTLLVLNEFPIEDLHTDPETLSLVPPGWSNLKDIIDNKRSPLNG